MKRKMAVLAIIGLILLAGISIAPAEERISGMVISVHLSPGTHPGSPLAIVRFADGRTRIFSASFDDISKIKVNEFITIYCEGNRIISVERNGAR